MELSTSTNWKSHPSSASPQRTRRQQFFGGDDDDDIQWTTSSGTAKTPQSNYCGIVAKLPGTNDNMAAPMLLQVLVISAYIGADTVLRFLYQDVIAGKEQTNNSSGGGNYEDDEDEDEAILLLQFDKPMFLSFCSCLCFAFWGFLVVPYVWWYRRQTVAAYLQTEWCGALSLRAAVLRCVYVAVFVIFQNYFYMSGLRHVRVAISTAVGQSEAPMTVGLTVLALGRSFAYQELRGVLLCMSGIALIVIPLLKDDHGDYDDDNASPTSVVRGVIFTMSGAFCFSVYQVFWQKFDEERYPPSSSQTTKGLVHENVKPTQDVADNKSINSYSQVDIGGRRTPGVLACVMDSLTSIAMIGLCNIGVGFILLIVMHVTGAERLEWPESVELWRAIATSCFLCAFVDAMAGVACVVASAVIVAMSYPLSIPLSVVIEQFWSGIPISAFGWAGWMGTLMVLAGIFFLEVEEEEILAPCGSPSRTTSVLTSQQCEDGASYVLSEDDVNEIICDNSSGK